MSKGLDRDDIKRLIIVRYENTLWELCRNEYGDEPTECLPINKTQEEKFGLLTEKLKLSLPVVEEVIKRYLHDQELTIKSHSKIKGIDIYKQAGFLTFWIVKLKPIMNLVDVPMTAETLINEQVAISISAGLLEVKHGKKPPFSLKLIDDLKYTLRYRIHTRNDIALIYESLCCFFAYPE